MNWLSLLMNVLNLILGKSATPVEKPSMTTIPETSKELTYKLIRKQFRPDGIFSELTDQNGTLVAHTLEHSYNNLPKIYDGTFKCVRGQHRLNGMTEDFTTFEITGVTGHVNILYHWGNYDKDSEGCILLGQTVVESNNTQMVTNSKETFDKFMISLNGVNEFTLIVS